VAPFFLDHPVYIVIGNYILKYRPWAEILSHWPGTRGRKVTR